MRKHYLQIRQENHILLSKCHPLVYHPTLIVKLKWVLHPSIQIGNQYKMQQEETKIGGVITASPSASEVKHSTIMLFPGRIT